MAPANAAGIAAACCRGLGRLIGTSSHERPTLSVAGATLPPMTLIALFHSVLGVKPGVLAAAEVFRDAGHRVRVVDQYDGRVFDDYAQAGRFAESIGYPALMAAAVDAVADESAPLVAVGFSNGGGMAEFLACSRGGSAGGVLGTVQFSGALPLAELHLETWPAATPVQLHYSVGDPFRRDEWIDAFLADVGASGSTAEQFLDYPGDGHLFTDSSLADEFDPLSTSLAFDRALSFVARVGGGVSDTS